MREWEAQVLREECHHLPAHLQVGDVGVEEQTVDAVLLEADMPVQHFIDVGHDGHGTGDSA